MKENHPVLIVGAGPTGLTAALELSRWRVPVRIVDQAPAAAATSRALAVQSRTLELFSQRGLTDEMLRLGNRARAVHIHSDSKQLGTIDLETIPSRFNFVLLLAQNETERILCEQLRRQGVEVERSTELVAFSQPEGGPHGTANGAVTAVLRHAESGLEELETSYLICAEGSHSNIRHTLNLEFKGKSLATAYALADLYIDGDIPQDALSIFIAEQGFLGLFPMGNRRFRMIATDPERHAQDSGDPQLPELQKLYSAEAHIPATLRDPVWTARFRINSRMLNAFRENRVFFGGDSAHIHSPAGGQGMNTGIQDMINLGWKLALVYNGQARSSLLDTYTEERLPVIQNLLMTTEKATDAISSPNAIMHQLVTHLLPFALDFETIQRRGARAISEIEIDYRSSRLSQTTSAPGQLRAGDRVPDLNVIFRHGGTTSTAPVYSVLDPSSFTLLITGDAPEPSASNGWPASMKPMAVRPAEDTQSKQNFHEHFGTADGLFAIRPDAYVGFAGEIKDHEELARWFSDHFLPSAASPRAAHSG